MSESEKILPFNIFSVPSQIRSYCNISINVSRVVKNFRKKLKDLSLDIFNKLVNCFAFKLNFTSHLQKRRTFKFHLIVFLNSDKFKFLTFLQV